MNRGKLYGVGVGPGDPELLTRKAERIIRASAVLAVPDKGAGDPHGAGPGGAGRGLRRRGGRHL